ncbi:MAG TPA: sigma-70 family RNA polymerase sigma factor [Pseudonocardiaceae bacterium]
MPALSCSAPGWTRNDGRGGGPRSGTPTYRTGRTARREPDEEAVLSWQRSLVHGALLKVPPRQRAVLVLRYFEDLSVAQTAAVMGCTEGTVKSQAARGLDNLRTAMSTTATGRVTS